MVDAFRITPGRFEPVARATRLSVKTVKRAWQLGWSEPEWARPITNVFDDEAISARAEIERRRAEKAARLRGKKEQARLDAEEERIKEGQAVRGSLNTSLMLFSNIGLFSRVSIEMCKRAADDLEKDVAAGNVTWREALKVQSQLSLTSKRISEQLLSSMDALRKHLGEPEKLLGVVSNSPSSEVDAGLAVARLGEDGLRKAILDLVEGRPDSPEATALVEIQTMQGRQSEVH